MIRFEPKPEMPKPKATEAEVSGKAAVTDKPVEKPAPKRKPTPQDDSGTLL